MFHTDEFGDLVGKLCLAHYDKFVKTGKPQKEKQWTHLAAILVTNKKNDGDLGIKVVSMGTGTKCVGLSKRNRNGYVLHDSHAEVLARRAFLRYLYFETGQAVNSESSTIFNYSRSTRTCSFKPNIHFHMFVSHTPCGDASIFPKSPITDMEIGNPINDDTDDTSIQKRKRLKLDTTADLTGDDIQRTGAKCLPTGPQDPNLPGTGYHITKAIRLKPGRGEPTRSLSCSDKMSKWNVMGLQGALLSHFLDHPIYLTSLIFASCPFDKAALYRAVVERIKDVSDLPPGYRINVPHFLQSKLRFDDGRFATSLNNEVLVPCPSAIIWSAVPENSFEVTVQGKKQGITKKAGLTDKAACYVCKKKLFDQFHNLRLEISKQNKHTGNLELDDLRTYQDWKKLAINYQNAKKEMQKIMTNWPSTLSTYEEFNHCNHDPNEVKNKIK